MKLVIGNQKSYMHKDQMVSFVEGTKDKVKGTDYVIMCASDMFFYLFEGTDYKIGAQNVSITESGPTTGEVSATQLKSMNVTYGLVGHSERRQNQEETDVQLYEKLMRLFEQEINPIFCIGESRTCRAEGKGEEFILSEITGVFDKLTTEDISKLIVAYEPIWAISDGKSPSVIPTNDEIRDITVVIKNFIKEKYGAEVQVLYGGSVNMKNVDELNLIEEVDGYLIGGASQDPANFGYIIDSQKK